MTDRRIAVWHKGQKWTPPPSTNIVLKFCHHKDYYFMTTSSNKS